MRCPTEGLLSWECRVKRKWALQRCNLRWALPSLRLRSSRRGGRPAYRPVFFRVLYATLPARQAIGLTAEDTEEHREWGHPRALD